jgi:hypothetical protein
MSTPIQAGERVMMSCIYNDREVTVLEVLGPEARVRFEETGQIVVVPVRVLYT